MFAGGFNPDTIYVPQDALLDAPNTYDRGHTLLVRLQQHDTPSVNAVTAQLKDAYDGRKMKLASTQTEPDTRRTNDFQFIIVINFLLALAVIVAVVGGIALMGALSIGVVERTKEIGVLRAMGIRYACAQRHACQCSGEFGIRPDGQVPSVCYCVRRGGKLMDRGIIDLVSASSIPETVRRLEKTVQEQGLEIFALIDHSAEAARVGLAMNPTQLRLFGSPKAGTPLMVATPSLAIDLPLKALVWQDVQGKVWLSYNDPAYLQQRHSVPPDLMPNIAGVGTLLERALKGSAEQERKFF